MAATPEVVLFDLGGVMIDFDFDHAFDKAREMCGLPTKEIRRRLLQENWETFKAFETGRLSPRELHAEVETILEAKMPWERFLEMWVHIFTGEYGPATGLLRGLNETKEARTAALSNTNELHIKHLWETWPRLHEFEAVFVSNEIGARKPDAEIYLHAAGKLDVEPERIVFLDDMEWNVEGARKIGMKAVHVSSVEALRDGLIGVGFNRLDIKKWTSPPFPEDTYRDNLTRSAATPCLRPRKRY